MKKKDLINKLKYILEYFRKWKDSQALQMLSDLIKELENEKEKD